MIRVALLAATLAGCASAPVCNCKLPAPPDSLLVVPKPLPPIFRDLPPVLPGTDPAQGGFADRFPPVQAPKDAAK